MLLAIANGEKIAQNCLKLQKSAQRQLIPKNLKYHQKLRFWRFSERKLQCVEGVPKHVPIVWIFNTIIFHMPFLLLKKNLCM
jgi:hypothetical protein